MDILGQLGLGFSVALTPENLFYCFLGSLIGTLIGVLPGIGPTAGIAILIPVTAGLDPTTAIIMMAGIYYGSMYGGSTTAILISTPGEAASVPTTLDGYQMARQGRAGSALGMAAISSFIAGTVSIVLLMLLAPPLASMALAFGPSEYFSLMTMGLVIIISLAGKSLVKGLIAGMFGMFISTIGLDPMTGQNRLAFGTVELMGGIDFISVVVGLFAIPEVLSNMEGDVLRVYDTKLKNIWPTLEDWKRSAGALWRSSFLGFFIGVLPGASAAVASFIAYDVEKKCSKHPELFGTGVIEGVAAPEGANNSASGGGMVPLLTLGIPASAPLAVLMGALMIHGLRPGPLLFQQDPRFVWGLIASMYIGNVVLLVLNLPLVGLWAKLVKVPYPALAPTVLILCIVGAYGVRNNLFDVWVTLAFGVLGYLMRKLDYPSAPVVLALILSPMMEKSLRQALIISNGSLDIFFSRPMSLALLLLATASIVFSVYSRVKAASKTDAFMEAIAD
ncbi:MAG: tripartite tricarboxylate transporter permease [Chloroflexota bacterium]